MPKHTWIPASLLMLLSAASAVQAQRATITGKVRYAGPALNMHALADEAQRSCGTTASARIQPGLVSNVVVFLEGVQPVEMNAKPIELRNANCSFEPAVLAAEQGATLTLVNRDPMLHVVQMYRSGQRVREYELKHTGGSRTDRRLLKGTGRIDVQCRWHTWMHSTIWVFNHPHYAVTAENGTFTLPFVVPGTYRISIWHPQLGLQTRDITVSANQVLPLDFQYQPAITQ